MTQQLPAHLQRYQSRDVGQTLSQNLGTASPPYVSIQGGRFTLIDAAGNEMPVPTFDPAIGVYLDACIIDVGDHISRVYYATKFDPSAQTFSPPDCWSDNGVGPSISATAPQSQLCASCPQAVWGSAISAQGKQIPACSMVQKVALLIPGIPQTVFLLRVPPNSHKHLRAYVELSRGSGVNIADVLTRIYFDQTTQGTLLFKGVSYIDEPTAVVRESAYAEKKADTIVGRNDVPRPAAALPSAAAQPQIAGPQTMPQGAPTVQHPSQQVFPATAGSTGQAPLLSQPHQPVGVMQQSSATFGQHQQVQQPGPFANAAPSPTITSVAAPPSEPAPAPRRRRRTAAEIAAANGAPAGQPAPQQAPQAPQAPQAAAAAPQAPFPHPGQAAPGPGPFPASQQAGALPGQTDMGFGMATGTPAASDPGVSQMLDNFFGKS